MSNPTPRSAPQGRLAGKVSLITGAAQGIGEATALKFATEGAIVIVCDINPAGIEAVVQQCRALGAEAEGHVMDVTDRATIDAVVAKVQERHGRIDVLVNNAGITQDARLVEVHGAAHEVGQGGTNDTEDGRHDPAEFLGAGHDGAGEEANDQADNEHLDESHTSVPLK